MNGKVSDLVKFTFTLHVYPGPDVKVTIDFIRNTFVFIQWNLEQCGQFEHSPVYHAGSVTCFQKQLPKIRIWDWDRMYYTDGIIVDGKEWSVVLETKGNIYKSEGLDCFPKEWNRLCRALSRLTGVCIR